jgi:hypothetical protein
MQLRKKMKWFKTYLISLTLLIIVVFSVIAYSYLPLAQSQKTIPFSLLTSTDLQSDLPTDLPVYLAGEQRTLNLSYPAQLWAGEEGTISMSVNPVNPNALVSDESSNSNSSGYNVDVETRLELDNIDILPGETIIEPIKEGKPLLFIYKINSNLTLQARGKLWVYLNIIQPQSGKNWQITRLAIPLESEINTFLGMMLSMVSVIGFSLISLAFIGILFPTLNRRPLKKKTSR